jgi:hypothetical protein
MRGPFQGVSPTTLQVAVGALAALHLLAVGVWLALVATGRIGWRTAWETPPARRRPRPRPPHVVRAAGAGADADADADADAGGAAAALRRRRRRERREATAGGAPGPEGDGKKGL